MAGQGFASMDKEKLKEAAARGGKIAHTNGKAYKFTTEVARAAGAKGLQTRLKRKEA